MTNAFSIGVINVTDYVLVVARKVSNSTAEAERHYYGPAPSNIDAEFTTLEPTDYYIDLRDSPDGTALGTLLATYVFNAQFNQITSEKRFYTCGGSGTGDPAVGDATIVDPYFTGKLGTAINIFKEGFRWLKPVTEWTVAVDSAGVVTGTTLTVTNGTTWSLDEVITVEITYKDALQTNSVSGGPFDGVLELVSNTTISSTHYNKRLKCKGSAVTLVHTFPDLSTLPDGKQFYFSSFGGTQKQTRILLTGTDKIWWDGFNTSPIELPEIWIGKGEWIWFEKRFDSGSSTHYLDVLQAHHGIAMVGERIAAGYKSHPNTYAENFDLLDGDEWPRMWYWLNNILPANHLYTDDTCTGGGFVPASGKEGQFVKHSTLKKFRMPVTEGFIDKGLTSFDTYGADTTNRPIDYPGGTQGAQVGEFHLQVTINKGYSYTGAPNNNIIGNGDPLHLGTQTIDLGTVNTDKENRVKNNGVIFLRRM